MILSRVLLWAGLLIGVAIAPAKASAEEANTANKSDAPDSPATQLRVPDGFTVQQAAGPPLVTHPTMGCLDPQGRLYVCNNAGVNMSREELEQHRPNAIRRLVDRDGDGVFDSSTVFADRMTFPMGAVWHAGSLYVASPPNIWRLTDTDDDGVADEREAIVSQFGYTGNAASIHGCFLGPDGRLYWTDGYHGHEFKDASGRVTSSREGSYLFSCRTDGSDVQIHCGGGMDNPVEVDFTAAGDMLGTVNILYTRPRVDALVHWLHGGVYPHRERVLEEVKVTGDWLGPVHPFGHVAVSGLTRYRSRFLNPQWQDDWFVTFFNSGQVVRVSLQQAGSSFSATEHPFLSSTSRDFHPTDVLEDADGSLLVIDTGGWFYRGCPTSQLAKPEIQGGIYRIRPSDAGRAAGTSVADPRGLQLPWDDIDIASLIERMEDPRFAVRQRALDACVARGRQALAHFAARPAPSSPAARRNEAWVLVRLAQDERTAAVATDRLQTLAGDADSRVRQVACIGLARSVAAVDPSVLLERLKDEVPGVARHAARAVGMQRIAAVPQLVAVLERPRADRSLQHAAGYALLEIADSAALRSELSRLSPLQTAAQRAAWPTVLLALDQTEGAELRFEELSSGLRAADPRCQQVAVEITKRNPQWQTQAGELLGEWFGKPQVPHPAGAATLLTAFINSPPVTSRLGGWLAEDSSREKQLLVLKAMAGADRITPPESALAPLRRLLHSTDEQLASAAIAAIRSLKDDQTFAEDLVRIGHDAQRSPAVRLDALAAIVATDGPLEDESFQQLVQIYQDVRWPTASARAATTLSTAQLSATQLRFLARLLPEASPSDLRTLAAGFARPVDQQTARAFFEGLRAADARLHLSAAELDEVTAQFPAVAKQAAADLIEQLEAHREAKVQQLQRLRDRLPEGDVQRGKALFASEAAKCATCHRVENRGQRVGPDLTTIGANRAGIDLLESIVFPSASIVRDYQAFKVLTVDGQVLTGLLVSESQDRLRFQQADGTMIDLSREAIEEVVPSEVSLMPSGLDETLTTEQLVDIVSYLKSLKPGGSAAKPGS
ncbi:PVC-type heme-binding CxxCH protein [Roseimaritima sediminicola]|uniref:PVC-type heme-binding CxxCH protein n=1 Tax=Roseimaritima sediminicola TaxID=2662066 RepID=UPI001386E82F|nr:PVC-type heme-binding CxxCH protein [Roseimaritima sediminicola]